LHWHRCLDLKSEKNSKQSEEIKEGRKYMPLPVWRSSNKVQKEKKETETKKERKN
jgi:hypothetical protein